MDSRPTMAARNNADWCDIVCRSHGAATRFAADAWTSTTRTPNYYPDAVTLVPDVSVTDLLRRVDASAGCSIKDSFATLDLTSHGFRVLFEAEWIVRPVAPAPMPAHHDGLRWELVRDPSDLRKWEAAWREDATATDVFRAELIDDHAVAVVAANAGDDVVAGAILNRSRNAVGISNFFADPTAAPGGWAGCLAFATSLFPNAPLVGYESGERLAEAQRDGFDTAGPLRVWANHT